MDENRLPFARSFYCSRFDSENGYHLRSSWTNPDLSEALSSIQIIYTLHFTVKDESEITLIRNQRRGRN